MSRHRADALLIPAGLQPRDTSAVAARLAHQFLSLNRATLHNAGVAADVDYDGSAISLRLAASTTIGAFPLLSPTTGRPEFSLIIRPRFPWAGIGPMLADMGWRVVPTPIPLPMLQTSDRQVPRWVLASMILFRLRALLKETSRRFEMTDAIRHAPRGSVGWNEYATRSVARGRFLDVPCRYPELQSDRDLRSAIRFALQQQLQALASQSMHGTVVTTLIAIAAAMDSDLRDVAPRRPSSLLYDRWLRRSLRSDGLRRGVEAMQWSIEQRGLAGVSDLAGVPWMMRMDEFFEAWGETIVHRLAAKAGGIVRTGRQHQTLAPVAWYPPFDGSQPFLLPDLILERDDVALIVDTKYKQHFEELEASGYSGFSDAMRESHRADFLQALAYANVSSRARTVVCLAYPCSRSTWESMKRRRRVLHRGSLRAGGRDLDVALAAFPMGVSSDDIATELLPLMAP